MTHVTLFQKSALFFSLCVFLCFLPNSNPCHCTFCFPFRQHLGTRSFNNVYSSKLYHGRPLKQAFSKWVSGSTSSQTFQSIKRPRGLSKWRSVWAKNLMPYFDYHGSLTDRHYSYLKLWHCFLDKIPLTSIRNNRKIWAFFTDSRYNPWQSPVAIFNSHFRKKHCPHYEGSLFNFHISSFVKRIWYWVHYLLVCTDSHNKGEHMRNLMHLSTLAFRSKYFLLEKLHNFGPIPSKNPLFARP